MAPQLKSSTKGKMLKKKKISAKTPLTGVEAVRSKSRSGSMKKQTTTRSSLVNDRRGIRLEKDLKEEVRKGARKVTSDRFMSVGAAAGTRQHSKRPENPKAKSLETEISKHPPQSFTCSSNTHHSHGTAKIGSMTLTGCMSGDPPETPKETDQRRKHDGHEKDGKNVENNVPREGDQDDKEGRQEEDVEGQETDEDETNDDNDDECEDDDDDDEESDGREKKGGSRIMKKGAATGEIVNVCMGNKQYNNCSFTNRKQK